ncbi:hypothetical protein EJ08DRAFT_302551 [Tothia fuscella]|uniref:Asteroid domain-containing protein n=1 Tax=Tothia fuscella TaxID=1048955 RepID=A0A9P4NNM1_9PEZI|nr:hypothetical protein EJ08DRAFT_302551 [Tothia fuscella]
MGIPHLIHSLSPYAKRHSLPQRIDANEHDNESTRHLDQRVGSTREHHQDPRMNMEPRENAIIDGPALAYHAYYRALKLRKRARNALEAIPEYSKINSIALDCLETLERHGFHVAAIFFDGFLPSSKRDTRFERQTKSFRQMENFRSSHPSGVDISSVRAETTSLDPFSGVPVLTKLMALPSLPLLVASVIEHLSKTHYAEKSRVVIGEADAYCASFANEHGGSIFTSDSDLLAYNLGENGSVIFLANVELINESTEPQLRLEKYQTTSIAHKLGLSSLQPLAYAMQRDLFQGLTQCVEVAKKLESPRGYVTRGFEQFMQLYSFPEKPKTTTTWEQQRILECLDPRTSEWVLQTMFKENLTSENSFDMFLPFLIEDSSRASAWNIGEDVRTITYSVFCPNWTEDFKTTEYCRRGDRISGKTIDHLSPPALESSLSNWCNVWEVIMNVSGGAMTWRLIGLYMVCQQLLQEEKPLPTRGDALALLSGKKICGDWIFLHLFAQLEAALCSWRMFYQVTALFLATPVDEVIFVASELESIKRLFALLQNLPNIQDLFTWTGAVQEQELQAYIETLYELLGVQEEECSQSIAETYKSSKRKRKKDRKRNRSSSNAKNDQSAPFSQPTNMYALLSTTE